MHCIFYSNEQGDDQQNEKVEALLQLLKEVTEERDELLASNRRKDDVIRNMNADMQKSGKKIAADILKTVFTPGQVKMLMSTDKTRIRWSAEDIYSAIALRCMSARAYRYLREVKQIPLPCVQTLRNWTAAFTTKPGILHDVVDIMQSKGENMSVVEKLTVLSFDEVYISNKVDLERREQKIYGSHKTAQFVMARGLFGNWKQPVFYDFDRPMKKEILFNIIERLHEAGYTVVAIASDMGPTNAGLWKDLNVGSSSIPQMSTKNL